MKLSTRFNKILGSSLLLLLLAGFYTSLAADEKSLEETLQRMERLLQQQQQELEAQRKELAEQRTLIRQLQEDRGTPAKEPVTKPVAGPGDVQQVAETDSDGQSGETGAESKSECEHTRARQSSFGFR